MKTIKPEDILRQEKYASLQNLVLICEAMEEYVEALRVQSENNAIIESQKRMMSHFELKK